jgi:hypothetical protein
MPQINDFAIDESFYSDDEDRSEYQDDILSLIRFILKSINLKTLLRLGFKNKHLLFFIINFTQSPYIPKVQTFLLNLCLLNNI